MSFQCLRTQPTSDLPQAGSTTQPRDTLSAPGGVGSGGGARSRRRRAGEGAEPGPSRVPRGFTGAAGSPRGLFSKVN